MTEFTRMPGWPPDEAAGEWVGWDHTGGLCILRWAVVEGVGKWAGVRFDARQPVSRHGPQYPQAFVRGPDTEGFVIEHRFCLGARGL